MSMRHAIIWVLILFLIGWFIHSVSAILLPFVLGAMMAYLMDPIVDAMQEKNMQRGVATAIVTIISFTLLVLLIATAAPLLGEQLANLLRTLPEQIREFYQEHSSEVEKFIYELKVANNGHGVDDALTNFSGMAGDVISKITQSLFASGAAILNVLSLLLITPVVTFYLLRDWDDILHQTDELLPRHYAPTIRAQLLKMDETISGFLRGQMLVCSALASFYVVGLTLMSLNFSVVIGAAAGFLIIIPYAGWFAAASVGMIVAFLQYDSMTSIAIIGAIFLAGQALESYFLTPKLVGDRVGLHPVWIIFAMLAGGVLLGFVGVLLAIPLAAIIGVLIRFALDQYKHSELYTYKNSTSTVK